MKMIIISEDESKYEEVKPDIIDNNYCDAVY